MMMPQGRPVLLLPLLLVSMQVVVSFRTTGVLGLVVSVSGREFTTTHQAAGAWTSASQTPPGDVVWQHPERALTELPVQATAAVTRQSQSTTNTLWLSDFQTDAPAEHPAKDATVQQLQFRSLRDVLSGSKPTDTVLEIVHNGTTTLYSRSGQEWSSLSEHELVDDQLLNDATLSSLPQPFTLQDLSDLTLSSKVTQVTMSIASFSVGYFVVDVSYNVTTTLVEVVPAWAYPNTTTLITVRGVGMFDMFSSEYRCRFGVDHVVNATRLSSEAITCWAPGMEVGVWPIDVSLDAGVSWSTSGFTLTVDDMLSVTETRWPSSQTALAATGAVPWVTMLDSALSLDAASADVSVSASQVSEVLLLSDFGFSLTPGDAFVTGVVVTWHRAASHVSRIRDASMHLYLGTDAVGEDHSDVSRQWPSSSSTGQSYGSETDRWTADLAPPLSSLGVGLSVTSVVGDASASIDAASVTLSYVQRFDVTGSVGTTTGTQRGGEILRISTYGLPDPAATSVQLACLFPGNTTIVTGSYVDGTEWQCTAPSVEDTSGVIGAPNTVLASVDGGATWLDRNITWTYTWVPRVDAVAVTPGIGASTGGTFITLTGSNFQHASGDVLCRFTFPASSAAAVLVTSTSVSPNNVTCAVPASPSSSALSSATIDVSMDGGTVWSDDQASFQYTVMPAVSAAAPSNSVVGAALSEVSAITLNGLGFLASLADSYRCRIGDAASSMPSTATWLGTGRVACDVPDTVMELAGTHVVYLSVNGQDFHATPARYTLVNLNVGQLSPSSGGSDGGTHITISGAGFLNTTTSACRFGGVVQDAVWLSASQMVCTSTAAEEPVPWSTTDASAVVEVSNNRVDWSADGHRFTYTRFPYIAAASGTISGIAVFAAVIAVCHCIGRARRRRRITHRLQHRVPRHSGILPAPTASAPTRKIADVTPPRRAAGA